VSRLEHWRLQVPRGGDLALVEERCVFRSRLRCFFTHSRSGRQEFPSVQVNCHSVGGRALAARRAGIRPSAGKRYVTFAEGSEVEHDDLISVRNCKTPEIRFRTLLIEGGAERLALVRA
jgi:hypothetical protein